MLSKLKMKKDEEPSILFEQLSAIENRFNKPGEQIPDGDDLIAAVLTAAPKEYVSILTAEQRSKGTALPLTDLELAMTQHWRQTTGTLRAAEEGNEVTLLGFNGIYYNCQAQGHRANECPEKQNRNNGGRNNNNNNRKFSRGGRGNGDGNKKNYRLKGNCNNCGKQGHAEATCWMKPANASNEACKRKQEASVVQAKRRWNRDRSNCQRNWQQGRIPLDGNGISERSKIP
jgi:hypothetical protein